MKRILTIALAAVLMAFCVVPASIAFAGEDRESTGEALKITLTHIPKYGSTSNVKGKVRLENGKRVKARDYRVTLFLQVEPGGEYWVKPTWEKPYVKLRSSGSFSLDYTTGGIDERAITLHIMVIPADYTPVDFQDTYACALDYVKVERSADGKNTVTE